MIGISFSLTSTSYYFDFLDHFFSYRKYLGVVGYLYSLIYSLSLPWLYPHKYLYGFPQAIKTWEVKLGLIAMSIFTFMTIISNRWGINKLGPKNWRRALRTGYLAYSLLIIRAVILEWNGWVNWWSNLNRLPPPRLVLSVFALTVISFRLSMLISRSLYLVPKKN